MSSSSDFVDCGRYSSQRPARTPEKSNFAQTCSLLSQYLKENGTFGDLSLGMKCNFEGKAMPETFRQTATATTTMNLFPVIEKSGETSGASTQNAPSMSHNLKSMNLFPQQAGFASTVKEGVPNNADCSVNKSEPETAQMTIFYAGQVIVFNDFPAEKAKEIMLLASKAGHCDSNTCASSPVQKPLESTNFVPPGSNVVPNFVQEHVRPSQPVVSDLPIARKASLTRFLEKRKDRITAKSPYQTSNLAAAPPSKPAESKSWLGLAAQSPLPFENQ